VEPQDDRVLAFVNRCQALLGKILFNEPASWHRSARDVLSSPPPTTVPAELLVISAVRAFVSNVASRDPSLAKQSTAHEKLAARAAQKMVASHHECDFGIQALAQYLRVSRSHLSRVIKRETGHSAQWHLTHTRLQHAERLLQDAHLSIKEVAAATGFRSTSCFDRQFHRTYGVPPSVYRTHKASPLRSCPQEPRTPTCRSVGEAVE
jgi:AraC-like DNA-binding protein